MIENDIEYKKFETVLKEFYDKEVRGHSSNNTKTASLTIFSKQGRFSGKKIEIHDKK